MKLNQNNENEQLQDFGYMMIFYSALKYYERIN